MNPRAASVSVVLYIPELLEYIQIYLAPHDLVQCAAVSKTFQALLTSFSGKPLPSKPTSNISPSPLEPRSKMPLSATRIISAPSTSALARVLNHFFVSNPAISLICTPSLQQQVQQLQKWRLRIFYGGGDRIAGQHDWLRAKGMFPGLDQVIDIRFRYGQGLYNEQQRQAEAQQELDSIDTHQSQLLQQQPLQQQPDQQPENIRGSNQQTLVHRQSASEAAWLIQQLDNLDGKKQRLFDQG
ncbi:MAG: hypothetical protein JOS17DRAFT_786857 [Linnemannia elongata]|nr:MAG: hypothetical protein JOS17DRAFT_786857 [Linnemannia elongata]